MWALILNTTIPIVLSRERERERARGGGTDLATGAAVVSPPPPGEWFMAGSAVEAVRVGHPVAAGRAIHSKSKTCTTE